MARSVTFEFAAVLVKIFCVPELPSVTVQPVRVPLKVPPEAIVLVFHAVATSLAAKSAVAVNVRPAIVIDCPEAKEVNETVAVSVELALPSTLLKVDVFPP